VESSPKLEYFQLTSGAICLNPQLVGTLLCFECRSAIWVRDLSDQQAACRVLVGLRGISSWRLTRYEGSIHLIWTESSITSKSDEPNRTTIWSAPIWADRLGAKVELEMEDTAAPTSRLKLLQLDSLFSIGREDPDGWPIQSSVALYSVEKGRLQRRQLWNGVDGLHAFGSSLILSQHCRQSSRPKTYTAGQSSSLYIQRNGEPVRKILGIPYSKIWGLSVVGERIYFCAKPTHHNSSQLFSASLSGEDQSELTDIIPFQNFQFGIGGYAIGRRSSRGCVVVVEQLGSLWMANHSVVASQADGETRPVVTDLGADIPSKEIANANIYDLAARADIQHWIDFIDQKLFNPTIAENCQPELKTRLDAVPRISSPRELRWLCRNLQRSLQSSHCRLGPANKTRHSTSVPASVHTRLRQQISQASNGQLHYLHLNEIPLTAPVPLDGLLLDLRGHPGGNRAQQFLDFLGLFFDSPVAWQVDKQGQNIVFPPVSGFRSNQAKSGDAWVVLIDETTRSDSELLAHAIRRWRGEREWPKLVGRTTAGDGLGYSKKTIWGSLEATIPEFSLKLCDNMNGFWLENRGVAPCLLCPATPYKTEASTHAEQLDPAVATAIDSLLSAFQARDSRGN
jgi:hypothetical protein